MAACEEPQLSLSPMEDLPHLEALADGDSATNLRQDLVDLPECPPKEASVDMSPPPRMEMIGDGKLETANRDAVPEHSTPTVSNLAAIESMNDTQVDKSHIPVNIGAASSSNLPISEVKGLESAASYLMVFDKRLKDLESKAGEKAVPPPFAIPPPEIPKESKRRVAVPVIARSNWYHFKNKSVEDKMCAIEVLMGPAKYYTAKIGEKKTLRQKKKLGVVPRNYDPILDADLPRKVPERVRIWSVPVITILSELSYEGTITGSLPEHYETHLRPFKNLLRLREGINDYLEGLETKWGAIADKDDKTTSSDSAASHDEKIAGTDSGAERLDGDSHQGDPTLKEPPGIATIPSRVEGSIGKDESKKPEMPDDITNSVEALRDLRCLKEFIDKDVLQLTERYNQNDDCKVYFHDLWYLFQPGVEVVAHVNLQDDVPGFSSRTQASSRAHAYQTAYKVHSTTGGRHNLSPKDESDSDNDYSDQESVQEQTSKAPPNPFIVRCYYIETNGSAFRPVHHDFRIAPFDGERLATSLAIFPARFQANYASFKENLIKRGRRFLSLLESKHMRFNGPVHVCLPCGCPSRDRRGLPVHPLAQARNITGEVVVDFREALNDNPYCIPETKPYRISQNIRETTEDWPTNLPDEPINNSYLGMGDETIWDEIVDEQELTQAAMKKSRFYKTYNQNRTDPSEEVVSTLEDDDVMLLPSRLMCYVLRMRIFVPLDMEYLTEITADPKGFESLELPLGHKDMVQALVEEHFQGKSHDSDLREYDLVAGKGQGLIILLHGVPGVGKTSTAECVAALTGRPLFPITCGDLGTTAESVETNLNHKFELAALWNCVLLLDEADIFLAQRDRFNLERNAIVSVFLRVLEYYTGLLFLTTNRVGAFDEAFTSRIHVSLYYPDLREDQTLQIWRKNLERVKRADAARASHIGRPPLEAKESKILEYARKHYVENKGLGRWNGRQIRNAFQTAAALAVYHTKDPTRAPVLGTTHFKTVAKATRDFEKYLNATVGGTEGKRAGMRDERAYNWSPDAPSNDQIGRKSQSGSAPPLAGMPYPSPMPFQPMQQGVTSYETIEQGQSRQQQYSQYQRQQPVPAPFQQQSNLQQQTSAQFQQSTLPGLQVPSPSQMQARPDQHRQSSRSRRGHESAPSSEPEHDYDSSSDED